MSDSAFNRLFKHCKVLLNAINTGLIILDQDLRVVHWNRWVANASGLSATQVYQQSLLQVFPELKNTRIHQAIEVNFELGMPAVISNVFNHSPLPLYVNTNKEDKEKTPLLQHIQITQIRLDDEQEQHEVFCLIHISDVTASVMREKLLEKHINERKSAQESIREARRLAEIASYTKSQFLANISHEIRTPLNGIMGMTELLNYCDLDEDAKTYIKALNVSSQTLLGIVNDVLDYSKINSKQLLLNAKAFNFRDLIDDIDRIIRAKLMLKQIHFDIKFDENIPQIVIGDKSRIKQVLISLLDNAAKFTEQGSVVLAMTILCQNESQLILNVSVEDTGIGISESDQDKIFESFSQGDGSITRKYGGTGLGLAISKQLVTLMDGELMVKSQPGKGSLFSFDLKLALESR
ncbi:PAS domain-containing sensor histidine kinase [sulfur-oxidizing endosymbiont of Gigantopelta aegis]|uniref:PAS domain-containing sensor histidine kinase n=1 Tax=sulfur-oxidizing endosymbiont of Gigantopelta aegis TaxID=2794934 RepID=UPI0018DB34D6|nr:ATP-binding protein [sulfur-oxidizing endosymbiont of Gigantopelta aegis]